MKRKEIQQILDLIEFVPDWCIKLNEIETKTPPNLYYLQIAFVRQDTYTSQIGTGWGRRWLLSDEPTEGEIVFTVWLAVQQILVHEGQEAIRYMGKRFISPHMPPKALVELADKLGV